MKKKPAPKKAPNRQSLETDIADSPIVSQDNAPFPTEPTSDKREKPSSERSEATDSTDGTSTAAAIASSATLATADDRSNETGDDRDSGETSVSLDNPVAIELSSRVERLPGEGRSGCHERLRRLARAAGMPRGQGPGTAYNWAFEQTDRLFAAIDPIPETIAKDRETIPFPAEVISSHRETISVVSAPPADDGSVSGLSSLPPGWPELPANAQLQVEIAWVTANRLRVRSGTGVDLSKALSPAPSYSALSWLETSILFPAKFADISVKATASQDDEKEFVKREKLAISEIRSILTEMLEAGDR